MNTTERDLIEKAQSGDRQALEALLLGVQDMIFNLSLRMLGSVPDAQDATQDILLRVMTRLSSFRGESAFSTWVYSLSVHHLLSTRKSAFAHRPLSFEIYGNDIRYANTDETDILVDALSRDALAEELKLSCTNVMLQCLDPETRCIFIMGTMFRIDSRLAAQALGISPEAYRQRLSRARRKMADFLSTYCGLTETGMCSCQKRVGYAVSQGRIHPHALEFAHLHPLQPAVLSEYREEMEQLDALSRSFEQMPCYRSPVSAQDVIRRLWGDPSLRKIREYEGESPCRK